MNQGYTPPIPTPQMVLASVITSEEVNYLVYRYLLEAGFVHSAFTFGQESYINSTQVRPSSVAPGLLVSVLQRGLQYSALEAHVDEDGNEVACGNPFSLLQGHVCDVGGASGKATETNGANVIASGNAIDASASASVPVPASAHISQATDAPLANGISTLNLALQNASIMASNAVYGSGSSGAVSLTSVSVSSAVSAVKPSGTSSSAGGGVVKKKPRKEGAVGAGAAGKSSTTSNSTSTAGTSPKAARKSASSSNASNASEFELIGHSSEVIGCTWNPKLPILATASGDSTVRLWSFPSYSASLAEINPRTIIRNARVLEHVLIKEAERSSDVTCLEWRRDGAQLATGCYDGKARIWTSSGDLLRTLQRHAGPIFTARWSPSGRLLLTGGMDGGAIVWDVEAGGVRHHLQHHTAACLDADWLNETCFVTASSDRTILFYDLARAPADGTGEEFLPTCRLSGHSGEVNSVRFLHQGAGQGQALLASGSDDCSVRLWQRDTDGDAFRCVAVLPEHLKEVYLLKWAQQGLLASASFDCTVRLWRGLGGSDVVGSGRVADSEMSVADKSSEMSVADKSSEMSVADKSSDNAQPSPANSPATSPLILKGHTQPVYAIAFSPCGRYLASGSLDESLLIWSTATGRLLKTFSASAGSVGAGAGGGIFDLEWMPEGDRLAVGNSDGRVLIFEVDMDIDVDAGADVGDVAVDAVAVVDAGDHSMMMDIVKEDDSVPLQVKTEETEEPEDGEVNMTD